MGFDDRPRGKLTDVHKVAVEAVLQDILSILSSRGIKAFITRRNEERLKPGKRWQGFRYDNLPEKLAWVAARTSLMKAADELVRPQR